MFSKTILPNGTRLILAPKKDTKAVTVLVLFPVGSRYESSIINGASHFIEHLMFKGTQKRPTTLDISRELDNIGAEYNAFTGKDHTGYYIKCAADKIELAFDILSDMLLHSKFDTKEINKERGVIIEEINMYQDNPLMYVENLLEELMFTGNPLAWQISGPRSVITKVSRKQLLDYKKHHYFAENTIIAVAGKCDKGNVKHLAQKYFGGNATPQKKQTIQHFQSNQKKPRVTLMFKSTQQVQLCLGFPGYSYKNKDVYALYLLAIILGGNMSSRLFINVREKQGLAYFIKAASDSYEDTGTFIVQAGLDKSRINSAIQLILKELQKVKTQGVTARELKGAKDFLKGKIVLRLEDSENIADWYGKQELFRRKIVTPSQRLAQINKVTLSQIKKAAGDVIVQNRMNLALIGPFKEKRKFLPLLKM